MNNEDFIPISNDVLFSIMREREQILAAQRAGKALTLDERKKLIMSEVALGCNEEDEEPLIETRSVPLEEAAHMRAIGEFTIGDVLRLFGATGQSRGAAADFLRRIQSGKLSVQVAHLYLTDCKLWESIKDQSTETCEQFLQRRYEEHQRNLGLTNN